MNIHLPVNHHPAVQAPLSRDDLLRLAFSDEDLGTVVHNINIIYSLHVLKSCYRGGGGDDVIGEGFVTREDIVPRHRGSVGGNGDWVDNVGGICGPGVDVRIGHCDIIERHRV